NAAVVDDLDVARDVQGVAAVDNAAPNNVEGDGRSHAVGDVDAAGAGDRRQVLDLGFERTDAGRGENADAGAGRHPQGVRRDVHPGAAAEGVHGIIWLPGVGVEDGAVAARDRDRPRGRHAAHAQVADGVKGDVGRHEIGDHQVGTGGKVERTTQGT